MLSRHYLSACSPSFAIVVGIIPHIKKHSPETRIIFRSHIEMRADLIREYPDGPQAETWKYVKIKIS